MVDLIAYVRLITPLEAFKSRDSYLARNVLYKTQNSSGFLLLWRMQDFAYAELYEVGFDKFFRYMQLANIVPD